MLPLTKSCRASIGWLPLAWAVIFVSVALRAEEPRRSDATLMSRLSTAKFIGLYREEGNTGHIVYVYSPERWKQNQEDLAKYLAEQKEIQDSIAAKSEAKDALQDRFTEFRRRKTPGMSGQTAAIVVEVGRDYLEYRREETPHQTSLLPIDRISRVVFVNDVPAEPAKTP